MKPQKDKYVINLFMHVGKLINDNLRVTLSEKGLHFGQARILFALLKHGELTQQEIGQGLYIQPATVTNMVKRMEVSKLIERKKDPENYKVKKIRLTEKGIEAAEFAHKAMKDTQALAINDLNLETLDESIDLLKKVIDNLGGNIPKL